MAYKFWVVRTTISLSHDWDDYVSSLLRCQTPSRLSWRPGTGQIINHPSHGWFQLEVQVAAGSIKILIYSDNNLICRPVPPGLQYRDRDRDPSPGLPSARKMLDESRRGYDSSRGRPGFVSCPGQGGRCNGQSPDKDAASDVIIGSRSFDRSVVW